MTGAQVNEDIKDNFVSAVAAAVGLPAGIVDQLVTTTISRLSSSS